MVCAEVDCEVCDFDVYFDFVGCVGVECDCVVWFVLFGYEVMFGWFVLF